jgi:membrane protease YdiL (CAAX protease family)
MIVASLAANPVLQQVGSKEVNGEPTGTTSLAAFLLLPFGLTGLLVLGWVRFVERRSLASIGLLSVERMKRFSRGVAVGIAMASILVLLIWIAGGYEAAGFARAFSSPTALFEIALLFFCFALQSSVEEILFRGWLLSVLTRKFNDSVGVAIVSIVFAFMHYWPTQHWLITLAIVLFSVFACCWCRTAGHVWGVMGWHAAWNWLLGTGFEVPITGIDIKLPALLVKLNSIGSDVLTGGPQGPEGSYFCSLLFVLASACIVWRGRSGANAREHAGASIET